MSAKRPGFLHLVLDGSFLLGAVATAVFYVLMHSPGMKDHWLHRFTTEHLVEYVVIALSFWGLADVLRKLAGFPREAIALKQDWMPEQQGREPASRAAELRSSMHETLAPYMTSRIGRRFDAALGHVELNSSAADMREHLKSLAEQDADRSHDNYTLVRFIVRVTPVLGFLGTVVHFGTALNGVSFDKMTDHMAVIVSEMGEAFNTTTSALASAMFMMFAQFVCEWIELTIIRRTDRTVEHELLNRFEVRDAEMTPFLAAVKQANDDALGLLAENLDRQTTVWVKAFEALFQRFDARQREEAGAWNTALETLATRHESYDGLREERLRQLFEVVDDRQERILNHIHETLERASALRDNFGDFVDVLRQIADGEGKLAELQAGLDENLRTIRQTQQFDEALHGLTAAIHLLTARHGAAKAA